MGIHELSKVIGDKAPSGVKENEMKNLFGRKIAIDASMSIYQFLIAVRSEGANLTNDEGETTSHLSGLFYRTIRIMSHGIKPLYVFDGKPPTLKGGELAKRKDRRVQAQTSLDAATETGDKEDMEKFSRRLVRVLPEHNAQCQDLLRLMGVPFIIAPCEAEAQCAELVKSGMVYATATEDMDALTFGSSVLLRHMTFSEARKMPIQEFYLDKVLTDLELTMDQFIDLCILLGCDYCDTIRGVGRQRAITLIQKHGTIEEVLKNIDTTKLIVPEDWKYKEARELFKNPEVHAGASVDFKWEAPDVDALVEFMCTKHGFAEDRIRKAAEKLAKTRTGATQGRLDSFFKPLPGSGSAKRKPTAVDKKNPKGKKPNMLKAKGKR